MEDKENRDMASSLVHHLSMKDAIWTNWTNSNAVKEGYKISGWVFKSVSMITKNISSVSWNVVDVNDKVIEGHPITELMKKPNPAFSRQDVMELISGWQQLTGTAYLKKVTVDGQTKELWPVSPDRISPVRSEVPGELLSGYEIMDEKGVIVKSSDYTPENIIPFKFLDPSDPLQGIGPLQVAARAVDTDVEQQNWNKSAMQSRGVVESVFTFDRDLDQTVYETTKRRLKELFGTGRQRIGVVGSNAKYQRLSLTPVEMDFIVSRNYNREEIFMIFGVPLPLAGVVETMTYSNYEASLRIFWELTLIPILDDIKDTLNRCLAEELTGYILNYDVSDIPALQQNREENAKTAKTYFDMGVPVSILNEMLTLGVPEYEGWEKSYVKQGGTNEGDNNSSDSSRTLYYRDTADSKGALETVTTGKSFTCRSAEEILEQKEAYANSVHSGILNILLKQRKLVFEAIKETADIQGAMVATSDEFQEILTGAYTNTAKDAASKVDIETRDINPALELSIINFLNDESTILRELSLINKSTVDSILSYIQDGVEEGKTITQIQNSIIDGGTFESARALRIARTVTGTAQSIGQLHGAIDLGAENKTWHDSNVEVRDEHSNRDGETVGINDLFSSQFNGLSPRYPLDQRTTVEDRVNCRCSMSFS